MFDRNRFNVSNWLRSSGGGVLIVFLAIGAFYLVTEHTAHVFGLLPFALLGLCLVMHLFMHGGHGSHNGHEGHKANMDGNTTVSSGAPHQHSTQPMQGVQK